jgi:hypothetical protein
MDHTVTKYQKISMNAELNYWGSLLPDTVVAMLQVQIGRHARILFFSLSLSLLRIAI